MILDLHYMVE